MSGFQCPYCNMIMSLSDTTKRTQYPSFENEIGVFISQKIHKKFMTHAYKLTFINVQIADNIQFKLKELVD